MKRKMSDSDSGSDSDHNERQRAINQTRDKGSSHWLSALPLENQGFKLNKGEFRD